MRRARTAGWLFAILAAAAGCDGDRDATPSTPPEATGRVRGLDAEATRMLAQVPADTPYVWINAEPLPDAYASRLAPLRDATLAAWARSIEESSGSGDPELAALAVALRGRMTPEGLRELGFETNPHFVLYGIGLAPVLRLELRDGDLVARLLERVDAADRTSEVRTIDGHPVWTFGGSDGVSVAVAVVDDELVATAYPPAVERELLPRAIGATPPRAPLLNSDVLRTARRDHHLLPYGLAMVDLARIVEIVAGEGDGLTRAVTQSWSAGIANTDCNAALRQWIARAPRVWYGLREIDARNIRAATIWELDRGLRDDLRGIISAIPGIGRRDRDLGLASVGVGVDVGAAIAMARRWTQDDRLAACEDLARSFPDDPTPSWAESIDGASIVLQDWDPKRARASGVAVLGVDDPVTWLKLLVPTADTDPLRRAGHAAPMAKVLGHPATSLLDASWIARGRHAIGIASGDGAKAAVRRAVGAERNDHRTLASWSVDLRRFDAIAGGERSRRDVAWTQAWALIDAARRFGGSIEIGDHGLELGATLELGR